MPRSFRKTLAASLLSLQGVTSACAADSSSVSPGPDSPSYAIILAQGNKVVIPEESLTVELLAVKDSRCPADVQCIWAGHAALTIQVGKVGSSPETLVIGTWAPPNMQRPYEATYGSYRLTLVGLEPANSVSVPVTPVRYRAAVKVTKL